jgi:hypothetical protein
VSVVDFLAEVCLQSVLIFDTGYRGGWLASFSRHFTVGERAPHLFDRRVDGPRASGMNAVVKRFFPSTPGIELIFSGNAALAT